MAATEQNKTSTPTPSFDLPSVEEATQRIRDLNERILESSKKAGKVYLDIYERTLNSIADYQEKVGEQSQVEWITTIANATKPARSVTRLV